MLFSLNPQPPTTGERNDSKLGDYLWTNTNFGEALPDAMTPLTWSMMQSYFHVNRLGIETPDFPMGGNIGGHLYLNMSLIASMLSALGFPKQKVKELTANAFGTIPADMDIPVVPFSFWQVFRLILPNVFRRARLVRRMQKNIPGFIKESPERAAVLKKKIESTANAADLLALWETTLKPFLEETMVMLAAGTSAYKKLSSRLRKQLGDLAGDGDANALMSGIQSESESLSSLGVLLGLSKLAAGEFSREIFLERYGHRGPSEIELSIPTPGEDPVVLARMESQFQTDLISTEKLIAAKQKSHYETWNRFKKRYPSKSRHFKTQLNKLERASQVREAARSEVVRQLRVFRSYAIRAGQIAGLGEMVFYHSFDELAETLGGDSLPRELLANRQLTYVKLRSLPPLPGVIRGRFNPFKWAADPDRSLDRFDATQRVPPPAEKDHIKGFAGSPGIVEGTVRVLDKIDDAALFQNGEILVANTTNIGWTPLFPRARAIITDIGAPLSHAAIVARELGVPAVVGTGNASRRLKTGDLVRVHGGEGLVELIRPPDQKY